MTGIRAAIDDAPIGMQPMYELLSLGAVAAMAPPTYLINKLLTTNGLATLVGAPGAGKSFVALDMVLEPFGQIAGDIGRAIVAEQPRLVNDIGTIAA
jgi:hypothetical protein